MFRDDTLIPTEAVRLCALGALMASERRYASLASEVRHFTSRIIGPSLELLGTSLELLRYEGLIEAVDGAADDPLLRITEAGGEAFHALLRSRIRSPNNDVSKLVVALKMRFMHLLDGAAQREQTELLVEMCENELARLTDLRASHAGDNGFLLSWLDQDIAQVQAKLAWFRDLQARL
jgi:hypothetical protein